MNAKKKYSVEQKQLMEDMAILLEHFGSYRRIAKALDVKESATWKWHNDPPKKARPYNAQQVHDIATTIRNTKKSLPDVVREAESVRYRALPQMIESIKVIPGDVIIVDSRIADLINASGLPITHFKETKK